MVLPFLTTCAPTMILAVVFARWWAALPLPVAFGIFVVVVGSDNQYVVSGTAVRVGIWMAVLAVAAAGVITLRRKLPVIMRSRG